MQDLTFGEQVKIILGRRGMTIKELAEMIEDATGKKMSRQNLKQRLSRDNFQEQDMRMIAEILNCPFELNIMEEEPAENAAEPAAAGKSRRAKAPAAKQTAPAAEPKAAAAKPETAAAEPVDAAAGQEMPTEEFDFLQTEREVTVGEVLDAEARATGEAVQSEAAGQPEAAGPSEAAGQPEQAGQPKAARKAAQSDTAWAEAVQAEKARKNKVQKAETPEGGEINPYTGREYESNSVRMHPKRIGYVQVYDQSQHQWVDMTEWAFLGYEERKKELMGDRYVPPIYLD